MNTTFAKRVLLTALLPVALVSSLLAMFSVSGRMSDLDDAYKQRNRALASQLAAAAQFGLFTRDEPALRALAAQTKEREADVRAVSILDAKLAPVAGVGEFSIRLPPPIDAFRETVEIRQQATSLVLSPVTANQTPVEAWYEGATAASPLLGYVAIEVTRKDLVRREKNLVIVELVVTLGGLAAATLLAWWLSRSVMRPVAHLSEVIDDLARGRLSARVYPDGTSPLHGLEARVNEMAQNVLRAQQHLEGRIAEATRELRLRTEEAEEATRAKSRFLAAASHDLRQPIHALSMFVQRLSEPLDPVELARVKARIETAARAINDLLEALLDISQLDSHVVPKPPKATPMSPIFDALHAQFSQQAQQRGLALRVRYSPLWISTDPALMYRILLNLVSNALRYTQTGGVLVGCRKRGHTAVLEVWDTGIGIPADQQKEIFKEFVQLGNPERDRTKGLGLGLAIVERTAGLLGHRVEVRSLVGRGSVFRVHVPLATRTEERADEDRTAALAALHGLRTLVVEDDTLAHEALVQVLQSWGCVVTACHTYDEALSRARAAAYPAEVVVCDYRLPGGRDGLELVQALRREIGAGFRAVLITGDVSADIAAAAQDAGTMVLHKPVRPAQLRAAINMLAFAAATSS